MRKNKGYQRDTHKHSWRKQPSNSYATGKNKTLEQFLEDYDKKFDQYINEAKKSYAKIADKTNLEGDELRKYCRDLLLWQVKFDKNGNLIPLEDVIAELEEKRERCKGQEAYTYVRRIIHKDNQKFVYNDSGGNADNSNKVRIPSMKRPKATWKRFYELFPYYKDNYSKLNNKNGIKLKKVW